MDHPAGLRFGWLESLAECFWNSSALLDKAWQEPDDLFVQREFRLLKQEQRTTLHQ